MSNLYSFTDIAATSFVTKFWKLMSHHKNIWKFDPTTTVKAGVMHITSIFTHTTFSTTGNHNKSQSRHQRGVDKMTEIAGTKSKSHITEKRIVDHKFYDMSSCLYTTCAVFQSAIPNHKPSSFSDTIRLLINPLTV